MKRKLLIIKTQYKTITPKIKTFWIPEFLSRYLGDQFKAKCLFKNMRVPRHDSDVASANYEPREVIAWKISSVSKINNDHKEEKNDFFFRFSYFHN